MSVYRGTGNYEKANRYFTLSFATLALSVYSVISNCVILFNSLGRDSCAVYQWGVFISE